MRFVLAVFTVLLLGCGGGTSAEPDPPPLKVECESVFLHATYHTDSDAVVIKSNWTFLYQDGEHEGFPELKLVELSGKIRIFVDENADKPHVTLRKPFGRSECYYSEADLYLPKDYLIRGGGRTVHKSQDQQTFNMQDVDGWIEQYNRRGK